MFGRLLATACLLPLVLGATQWDCDFEDGSIYLHSFTSPLTLPPAISPLALARVSRSLSTLRRPRASKPHCPREATHSHNTLTSKKVLRVHDQRPGRRQVETLVWRDGHERDRPLQCQRRLVLRLHARRRQLTRQGNFHASLACYYLFIFEVGLQVVRCPFLMALLAKTFSFCCLRLLLPPLRHCA
jgi:hypothetical protein